MMGKCVLCGAAGGVLEASPVTRQQYTQAVGLQLPEKSHLCLICSHLLKKLCNFKQLCYKRHSELENCIRGRRTPNDFGRTNNLRVNICVNSECDHLYMNDRTQQGLGESELSLDGNVSHYEENIKFEKDDLFFTHVIVHAKQLHDDVENVDEPTGDKEKSDNDTKRQFEFKNTDNEFSNNNENPSDLEQNDEFHIDDEIIDINNKDMNDEHVNSSDGNTETKDLNDLSVKKPFFEKIVLSLEEQKAVLENLRKGKKYLEGTYKCHSCAQGFLFKDSYQSHMVRHEESNGQYECATCGLRFASRSARIMHRALHSERHRCSECRELVSGGARRRHETRCWRADEQAGCERCGRVFRDACRLQQHLRRMHSVREKRVNKRFACNLCSKTYGDPGGLRLHMITHTDCRFRCARCPTSFNNPYALNRHARSHDAPAAAYCEPCGAWFKSGKTLRAHVRTSSNHATESFECATCGRACATKQSLEGHVQARHSREPAHACPQCAARCTSRKALLKHIKGHGGPASVQTAVCYLCGKAYKGQNRLNRHLKEVCELKDKDVVGT